MTTRLRRHLTLILVAAGTLGLVETAPAATYQVISCRGLAGGVNSAWTLDPPAPSSNLEVGNGCAQPPGELSGLYVQDDLDVVTSSPGVAAEWVLASPPGTQITALSYVRGLQQFDDPDWRVELRTGGGASLDACSVGPGASFCDIGGPDSAPQAESGFTAGSLRFGVRCSTGTCRHGVNIHTAQTVLYSSSVTIDDPTPPAVGTLTGTITEGGWLRGTQTAQVTGSDSTGVRDLRLVRQADGSVVAEDVRACDFTRPAPCATPGATVASDWGLIDTATLPDGNNVLRGVVGDAGGNDAMSSPVLARVDNTPPAAPVGLAATEEGWSSSADRVLFWTPEDDGASNIVKGYVELCDAADVCTVSPTDETSTTQVTLPSPGEWTATVWLQDEAGNVDPSMSATATLLYDPGAPPAPELGPPASTGGTGFTINVTPNDPGPAPLTELTGEVCDVPETSCLPLTPQTQAPFDSVEFAVPGPGTYVAKVRLTDAAGNLGAVATSEPVTIAEPTPTPTPTPSPSPSPTPTATIGPDPSPEPTAPATPTPVPDPTPEPTVTPPPGRLRVRIEIDGARLTRRKVIVRGALTKPATGRIALRVKAKRKGKRRSVTRTRRVRAGGRFRVRLRLPPRLRGIRRGRIVVIYRGDARHRPARARDAIGR